ncbi:hypothetical protein WAK64_17925 [Bacillus spongiae]|uniref:Uncharacterized protein n=1 Tax=Bacillus spongiae TaxID=2683610 RepID=A0ABU8HI43_9BACI
MKKGLAITAFAAAVTTSAIIPVNVFAAESSSIKTVSTVASTLLPPFEEVIPANAFDTGLPSSTKPTRTIADAHLLTVFCFL